MEFIDEGIVINAINIETKVGITFSNTEFDVCFYLVSSSDTEIFKKLTEKFPGLILRRLWQQLDDHYYITKLNFSVSEKMSIEKL